MNSNNCRCRLSNAALIIAIIVLLIQPMPIPIQGTATHANPSAVAGTAAISTDPQTTFDASSYGWYDDGPARLPTDDPLADH
jgi:hypothetical protein